MFLGVHRITSSFPINDCVLNRAASTYTFMGKERMMTTKNIRMGG